MTLVTEKEAGEMWCPMARVVPGFRRGAAMVSPPGMPSAHNRVQEAGYESDEATWHAAMNCIGSRCMAWRWHDEAERVQYETKSVIKKPGEAYPPFSNLPDGFEVSSYDASYFHCRKEISREPRRGYCGAFGKVEP